MSPSQHPAEPAEAAEAVAAVVVTHDRLDSLAASLEAVVGQSRPPRWLLVVDNAHDPRVRALVESLDGESGVAAHYLGSRTNLGGAGGFAHGMLHALALGADWVWCADDDGRPEGPEVLAELLDCAARHGLAAVSPLVLNIADATKLAFPLRRGLAWRRTRDELVAGGADPRLPAVDDDSGRRWYVNFASAEAATGRPAPAGVDPVDRGRDLLPGIASLFNGALISAGALARVGVPDYRLFIRGDEVEFHRRLARSGLRFGTCLTTAYLHPSGTGEFLPILGGRMHAQYPADEAKRYFTYRNRGYLMSRPGMRRLLPQEYARFAWFFLVVRRDPAGFVRWWALQRRGRRERFAPFRPRGRR